MDSTEREPPRKMLAQELPFRYSSAISRKAVGKQRRVACDNGGSLERHHPV